MAYMEFLLNEPEKHFNIPSSPVKPCYFLGRKIKFIRNKPKFFIGTGFIFDDNKPERRFYQGFFVMYVPFFVMYRDSGIKMDYTILDQFKSPISLVVS